MSDKDKKIDSLPSQQLDKTAADQVRGGAGPVIGKPKPDEPISELRKA